MFTMSLPVSTLSLCVTVLISAHNHADHVTACFHLQSVCDNLHLLPTIMLTMSLPVSTLRVYVTVSICCPASC